MPRFAGFISLGTPQFDANDLMSRMAGAYGITDGGLVQDVATDDDGAPVFGLVVTDPNCTTAQLEQRWDRRPGQWHVIDGRVDSIDGSPVEETNYGRLADLWRDDPTVPGQNHANTLWRLLALELWLRTLRCERNG